MSAKLVTADVAGDGNCFYYALLLAVGVLDTHAVMRPANDRAKRSADLLRQLFLQALNDRRAGLADKIGLATMYRDGTRSMDFSRLQKRLESGDWAEEEEVKITAHLFKLRICIKSQLPQNPRMQVWTSITANPLDVDYSSASAISCTEESAAEEGTVALELQREHYRAMLRVGGAGLHLTLRRRFVQHLLRLAKQYNLEIQFRHELQAFQRELDIAFVREATSVGRGTIISLQRAYRYRGRFAQVDKFTGSSACIERFRDNRRRLWDLVLNASVDLREALGDRFIFTIESRDLVQELHAFCATLVTFLDSFPKTVHTEIVARTLLELRSVTTALNSLTDKVKLLLTDENGSSWRSQGESL